MHIKAIETRYKGYRFRSRLEARWAVFFDAIGVKWEYEKDGYILSDGKQYLPDFWLPDLGWWWEVKGAAPSLDEKWKCEGLRDKTDTPVVLVHGTPPEHSTSIYCWDLGDSSGGSSDWDIPNFAWTKSNPLIPCISCSESRQLFTNNNFSDPIHFLRTDATGTSLIHETGVELEVPEQAPLKRAYMAARSARFEFGESGGLCG